jgi:hypothetical protein
MSALGAKRKEPMDKPRWSRSKRDPQRKVSVELPPRSLDLAQRCSFHAADRGGMTASDEKPPVGREADETPPAASEFRRMIDEYANELRQIVQKLRKRLH